MNSKKRQGIMNWLGSRFHLIGIFHFILMALIGQPLEISRGLVAYPPRAVEIQCPFGKRGKKHQNKTKTNRWLYFWAGREYFCRTWYLVFLQSLLVCMLYTFCIRHNVLFPVWVISLPLVKWLLMGISATCPWIGHQPEIRFLCWSIEKIRWLSLIILFGCTVYQLFCDPAYASMYETQNPDLKIISIENIFTSKIQICLYLSFIFTSIVILRSNPNIAMSTNNESDCQPVEIIKVEEGYQIRFMEGFNLTVTKSNPFEFRMIIIFLRKLENVQQRFNSRATRDGRRPMLTQAKLAECFDISQPEISQWEKLWLEEDWAGLLSMHSPEVLTMELRNQIVDTMGCFPWWSRKQIYQHLNKHGVKVTYAQINQAAQESGWNKLKKTLSRFFVISPDCIRPRDEWVSRELVGQIKTLLEKIEIGENLTAEEQLKVSHLQTVCAENDLTPQSEPFVAPWAQKVKWVLFAAGATMDKEDQIRCTYCGSTNVRIKSRQGREKRYLDESGRSKTVTLYRYYCCNSQCKYGSFSSMPLGLLPNSPYPLQVHLQAIEMYAWARSSYRRTAQALGVKSSRVYCWISAFGDDLLPIAAMFGVVKSSGVVGIDEKWVQVPEKNPRGSGQSEKYKSRRWMYVYLAIDVYTYDLLHIAIYAQNTSISTTAFLLALRIKGYRPRVIVTDLRQEYGPAIKNVFPNTIHHECIFHAMQWIHKQLKAVYGRKYILFCPEAVALKEKIDFIFNAKTQRTAEKRYTQVMELEQHYIKEEPEVSCIFDTLKKHWPTLVNGIESTIIPRTNNAVERIIGRFDQHYQNFRGFDSIESAKIYLGVFEKVYRFTPFTDDAQPRIRGKCPLELAGYDISNLNMSKICRGWALNWPIDYDKEVVPNM